ncbi:c-type cytochrome [Atopomonas sediminilitoris]|uniref:c-type cytochrome n=1 Tax=Atopomonas sediminilitoris TaxID=2919919 RepID=UPI001F4D8F49|nr:cytochrome c [Atopomonas sediminilitoris]MCJ8170842.1 cytochrome c [Atopomonas sediminilitoris]
MHVKRHTQALLMVALLGAVTFSSYGRAEVPDAPRQADLRHLLKQDCGSCHGTRLTGGLGTPLTTTALAGKPREGLIATVLHGRPGTAMPPWQGLLNEAEAAWLIDQLMQGTALP